MVHNYRDAYNRDRKFELSEFERISILKYYFSLTDEYIVKKEKEGSRVRYYNDEFFKSLKTEEERLLLICGVRPKGATILIDLHFVTLENIIL